MVCVYKKNSIIRGVLVKRAKTLANAAEGVLRAPTFRASWSPSAPPPL